MKKSRVVIFILVCVAFIVGCFYYVAHKKPSDSADNYELSEVEKVITKDFANSYPATPREVVKNYNRILECFYNEKFDEDELYALGDQARLLMDEELLAENTRDEYFTALSLDIASYRERERTISSTSICSSNEVEKKTIDGMEYAYVDASYFIKEGSSFERTYQEYVLRKDEDGNWKILAFHQTEGESSND